MKKKIKCRLSNVLRVTMMYDDVKSKNKVEVESDMENIKDKSKVEVEIKLK